LLPRTLRSQRQDLRGRFTLYLRLTFSILLFRLRCGYLAVSMFASLCDSFTISTTCNMGRRFMACIRSCDHYETCDSQSLRLRSFSSHAGPLHTFTEGIVDLRFRSSTWRLISVAIIAYLLRWCLFRTDLQLQLWGSQSLTRFLFDYWLHHLAGLQLPHRCFSQRFDAATPHNDFSIVFDR
jgi:hypothetical protein